MSKVHFNSINWISVYLLINLGFTLFPDTTNGDKCLQIDPVKKSNVTGFARLTLMRNAHSIKPCDVTTMTMTLSRIIQYEQYLNTWSVNVTLQRRILLLVPPQATGSGDCSSRSPWSHSVWSSEETSVNRWSQSQPTSSWKPWKSIIGTSLRKRGWEAGEIQWL